jgi:hypothetical protein
LANFADSRERSDSELAAAIRFRSLVIFSLRTRRRRISGLRLGADMIDAPWFQGAVERVKAQELLEAVFYVKARGSAEQQKMGRQFASPFLLRAATVNGLLGLWSPADHAEHFRANGFPDAAPHHDFEAQDSPAAYCCAADLPDYWSYFRAALAARNFGSPCDSCCAHCSEGAQPRGSLHGYPYVGPRDCPCDDLLGCPFCDLHDCPCDVRLQAAL